MPSRVLAILLALLASAAQGGPAQTFKVATLAPDGSAWMTEFRAAAAAIGARSDGRVAFKFYPGGVMGNDQSVLRKIRIGQLHGAALTGGGIAEVYPDSRIYGLPLMFRDQGELDFVRARMDATFNKGLEAAGFVNFGFADGGFAVLMSTQPIARLDDLRKNKAWVPEGDPISYAMIQALGVPPVTLPLTDVMTGLSTGLIATIGASPLGAVTFQWHTKVKFVTEAPFTWLFGVFCLDRKQFEKLSAADQAAVREVLGDTFRKLNAQNRIDDGRAREALAKQGLRIAPLPAEELAKLERIAGEVSHKLALQGTFDPKLYAQALDLTRQYRSTKRAAP